jgi:hypothetical protein
MPNCTYVNLRIDKRTLNLELRVGLKVLDNAWGRVWLNRHRLVFVTL